MGYQRERDEFISRASAEGLSLEACRKLLRYASTLHRLAEAQCNGDWPYNGDRDRPRNDSMGELPMPARLVRWERWYTVCPKCEASGVAKNAMRFSRECRTTPSGVRTTEDKLGNLAKVCPDCRTQELVSSLLDIETLRIWPMLPADYKQPANTLRPIFNGDPRGAVLRLQTPNHPWSDDGRAGYGLYVPSRGC